MQTQIVCPQCQTPYIADVHQIVDAQQTPELKQMLLANQLNLAVCPNCGTGGQLSTALLYHDAEHDLFMIHVPMELNLGQMDREQMIGQLTRQAMAMIPDEQKRGYLFQPQMMLNMQSFVEKVLETEGITPEMIARQKDQANLLRQLMGTDDREVVDLLLQDNAHLIDETFFAILRQSMEIANQANSQREVLRLTNLQARLYRDTAVGQRLEQRQIALHKFSNAVKKKGLSPTLLVEHIVANVDDEQLVQAIAGSGQQALDYTFFQMLTDEIERRAADEPQVADRLRRVRDELAEAQQQLKEASDKILQASNTLLERLLAAADPAAAVQEHLDRIDEPFLFVLQTRMADAHENGRQVEARKLVEIQAAIQAEAERQLPPEIRLLNELVYAESEAEQNRLLDENADLVSPAMLQLLKAVEAQVQSGDEQELTNRVQRLQGLVAARLGSAV